MKKLIAGTTCAISILALFSMPVSVGAQSVVAQNGSGSFFSIVVNPTYPVPYNTFDLSIKSYSFNISNAVFTVTINGVRTASGTGATPVSLKATGPGAVMNIKVSVTARGKIYIKTLIIHPADVAVVVEPLTTTPTLYPGMPTMPSSGKIRVVAIPNFRNSNGVPISPQKLSYTWHIGDQTISTSSGIGRSVVIVSAPEPYRNTKLSVTVQAQNYPEAAEGKITLAPGVPTVRIYKDDPLMGVLYDHALFGNQIITGAEASFVAEPYGFSTTNGLPDLVWYLNDIKAQTGNLVTLRPKGVGKGIATLSIKATKESSYESATDAITLEFGKAARNGLGIFGL